MPEPNTHTAIGIAASYGIGKVIGLSPDYLVIALVGALFAAARQQPDDFSATASGTNLQSKLRQTIVGLANMCGVSFVSASATAIVVLWQPFLASVAMPLAGLIGYFGTPLIKAVTNGISKGVDKLIDRLGG